MTAEINNATTRGVMHRYAQAMMHNISVAEEYGAKGSFPVLEEKQVTGPDGNVQSYVTDRAMRWDMSPGGLEFTQNKWDFALMSEGTFFVVQDPVSEKEYLTRKGSFTFNEANELVDQNGYRVMGDNGAITMTEEEKNHITVLENGLMFDDQDLIGQLRTVRLEYPNDVWARKGGGFEPKSNNTQIPVTDPKIQRGALEKSNINNTQILMELQEISRELDMIKNADDQNAETRVNAIRRFGEAT